jgi:hypothetical protein
MKDRKIILMAGILMIFLVGFMCQVSAYAVGASPATLSFSIPRGGYEDKTFQVSTNSATPLEFSLSVSDSINASIKVVTADKTAVEGKPAEITIRAYASRSAKPGSLDGAVTATLKPSGASSEGSGSVVSMGVAVRVKIEITDETAPLIKNKLAFATIVLVIILIVLAVLYFIKRKGNKNTLKRK